MNAWDNELFGRQRQPVTTWTIRRTSPLVDSLRGYQRTTLSKGRLWEIAIRYWCTCQSNFQDFQAQVSSLWICCINLTLSCQVDLEIGILYFCGFSLFSRTGVTHLCHSSTLLFTLKSWWKAFQIVHWTVEYIR